MRVASFDLETTNLNGNFGIVLCGCIKPFPSEKGVKTRIKTFRFDRYPNWRTRRSDDFEICKDIYEELKEYDIWIAHNGLKFDVPFLRTRLIKKRVTLTQPKIVDPVRLSRRYLRLGYNGLETVATHFGFEGKTRVDPDHWNRAALDGSKKSMDYIVDHCEADVVLLEEVTELLRPFVPKVTQWGSDT